MSSGSESEVYWRPAEFHVGRTLRRTVEVFTRNAPAYLAVCAVVQLPNLFFDFSNPAPLTTPAGLTWAHLLYLAFASSLSTALIVFAAFQDLRGRPVNIIDSVSQGLRRLVPVLLTSVCVGVGVGLGLVVFYIPGIIFSLVTYCALPVCVVEGLGPFSSITRSSGLTKGHRWGLFGVSAIIAITSYICTFVITMLTVSNYAYGTAVHALLSFVQNTIVGAFTAVMSVIIYNDLRVAKEGIDVEGIASVFD